MELSPSVDMVLCGYLLILQGRQWPVFHLCMNWKKLPAPSSRHFTSICAKITIINIGFSDGRHVNGIHYHCTVHNLPNSTWWARCLCPLPSTAPATGNWQRRVHFVLIKMPSHPTQKTHLKIAQLDCVFFVQPTNPGGISPRRDIVHLGRFREEQGTGVCSQGAHS